MKHRKRKNLRSREWFDTPELYGWTRQAALQGLGLDPAVYRDRPLIGICNTWSELTHCNAHLRTLAQRVKEGVWQAGGVPFEFPVISLGEFNMRPTSMLFRNLLSMDVEECIRANPLDGVVLLGGCDKTTPGLLMGAVSADLPAILVTGGPQLTAHWRGEELGSCTDCRRYEAELRAGRIDREDWLDLQGAMVRSPGHCMTMGTASTLATLAEALGLALPGNAAFPAADSRRTRLAHRAGRQIVRLVELDLKPSRLLSAGSFDNAIRTLHAIGGSTNAIVHLLAVAGRAGIPLSLKRFDELSKTTPVLLDLKPAGRFLMEDFAYAGGAPALLNEISPLLDLDLPTVTGRSLGENLQGARNDNPEVIHPLDRPMETSGGLAILHGSLAPDGCIIKHSAATPRTPAPSGTGDRLRRPPGTAGGNRRSGPGGRSRGRSGTSRCRPARRSGNARMGLAPHPPKAAQSGHSRHGPDQRLTHQRHGSRHGGGPRLSGKRGGRSPGRSPDRRSHPAGRPRPAIGPPGGAP